MSFYKLPHRPIRQAAPFALGNEFGAFLARRPRSHGKSAGEDRLSSREEIGAPVHLADWSRAAEIAMVSPTRHDAGRHRAASDLSCGHKGVRRSQRQRRWWNKGDEGFDGEEPAPPRLAETTVRASGNGDRGRGSKRAG